MGAGFHDFRLAEGDGVIGAGMRRAVVGFAVEALVFQEQHGIVAADGGAQQAAGVEGVRRKNHVQAGNVRENAFAALAVIDGAAVQISADGHTDHQRRGQGVVGAPAEGGELVANLHHRGPDVIEELDLDDRLHAARRHADGAADDGGLGDGRVEQRREPKAICRPCVALKTPPLPFTSRDSLRGCNRPRPRRRRPCSDCAASPHAG